MKRSARIRLAMALAVLFTLFAFPSPVKACSCIVPGPPAVEFAQNSAVFTGRVIRVVDNYRPMFSFLDWLLNRAGSRSYRFYRSKRYGYSVFFAVHKSWKGVTETMVEIHTGYGGGDCGYSFTLGNDYVVYANYAYGIPGNYWITGICSRTAETSQAVDDFNYLGTVPMLPLQAVLPIPWAEADLIAFLLPAVVVLALIVLRARRQDRIKQN